MMCKYCGREVKFTDEWEHDSEFQWHTNCKDNTLGIHIEEVIDLQDLFGR